MKTRMAAWLAPVLALAAAAPAGDDGVTETSVLLGQPAALKGPAEALGKGMQTGLNAAFQQINGAGGVHNRKIELKSINDSYEPDKSAQAAQMLIEKMKVFAIIGPVGTPTAKAAIPISTQAKTPYIGAFTGAELLRTPFNRYVINVRSSYYQETEELAKLLVDENGFNKLACVYQNDSFGQAGLEGLRQALDRRGMKLTGEGTFERNTVAIAEGLNAVAAEAPQAVLMVGPYKPCAEIVRAAKKNPATANTIFCTISFVGTEAFLNDVGAAGEGVIISQVVPFPWDTSLPVVSEFHEAMKAAGTQDQIGFISLEGYIAGRFFSDALAAVEGTPTRETFIDAIETTGSFDIAGFGLTFGPDDHQGSDRVCLTRFQGGKVVPFHGGPLASVEAPASSSSEN